MMEDTTKQCSLFGSCEDEPVVVFQGTDDSFWATLSSGCCPWIQSKPPAIAQPASLVERAVGGANSMMEFFGEKEKTESTTLDIGIGLNIWAMRLALGFFAMSMALVTYTYIVAYNHSDEPNTSTALRGGKTSAWACSRCQKNVYQSYMHRFKAWLVHGPEPSTVSSIPPYLVRRFVPYDAKAQQTLRKMKLFDSG